ncbi:hypothetical protein PMAC_000167 [Pneumocystis sp. 'macacae']|nr:hypothetical protein PMAC_000167 [Pneumocystis sp. 'macacae']
MYNKESQIIFLKLQIRKFFQSSYQYQDSYRVLDIIQELYLRALRSCKPYTIKPTDAEDQVRHWKLPDPPKIPEINLDVATHLDAYEKENIIETSTTIDTANPLDALFEEKKKDVHH